MHRNTSPPPGNNAIKRKSLKIGVGLQRHSISSFPGSAWIQSLDCNNHFYFSSRRKQDGQCVMAQLLMVAQHLEAEYPLHFGTLQLHHVLVIQRPEHPWPVILCCSMTIHSIRAVSNKDLLLSTAQLCQLHKKGEYIARTQQAALQVLHTL